MADYKDILEGIRIKQLFKLKNSNYNHPLKDLILKEGGCLHTGTGLNKYADRVAQESQGVLVAKTLKQLYNLNEEDLEMNVYYRELIGTINLRLVSKPAMVGFDIWNYITHVLNLTTMKDLINNGKPYRSKIKKNIKNKWYCKINYLWTNFQQINSLEMEKFEYKNKLINLHKTTSKLIRLTLHPEVLIEPNKMVGEVEDYKHIDYFQKVKKLKSVRHKNLVLRCWSGDILSNNRLYQMGLIQSNLCDSCGQIETRLHLVNECKRAKELWTLFNEIQEHDMQGNLDQAWLGINDNQETLELRIECLHSLITYRQMPAANIYQKSSKFIAMIKKMNDKGFGEHHVDSLLNMKDLDM